MSPQPAEAQIAQTIERERDARRWRDLTQYLCSHAQIDRLASDEEVSTRLRALIIDHYGGGAARDAQRWRQILAEYPGRADDDDVLAHVLTLIRHHRCQLMRAPSIERMEAVVEAAEEVVDRYERHYTTGPEIPDAVRRLDEALAPVREEREEREDHNLATRREP